MCKTMVRVVASGSVVRWSVEGCGRVSHYDVMGKIVGIVYLRSGGGKVGAFGLWVRRASTLCPSYGFVGSARWPNEGNGKVGSGHAFDGACACMIRSQS